MSTSQLSIGAIGTTLSDRTGTDSMNANSMNDGGDRPQPDQDYRPVSGLAVAAAVVGAVSAVSFVGPGLWFVPVIGIVLSVLAIRTISRPGVELLGHGAAVAGLALSIGVGCAAVSAWLVSWQLAKDRAVAVAESWAGEIRGGRLLVARSMLSEMMRPAVMTVSTDEDVPSLAIDDFVSNERLFRGLPVVAALLECGAAAVARGSFYEFVAESQEQREEWRVRLKVSPCPAENRASDELSLFVHLRRTMLRDAQTWWGWQDHWDIIGFGIDG